MSRWDRPTKPWGNSTSLRCVCIERLDLIRCPRPPPRRSAGGESPGCCWRRFEQAFHNCPAGSDPRPAGGEERARACPGGSRFAALIGVFVLLHRRSPGFSPSEHGRHQLWVEKAGEPLVAGLAYGSVRATWSGRKCGVQPPRREVLLGQGSAEELRSGLRARWGNGLMLIMSQEMGPGHLISSGPGGEHSGPDLQRMGWGAAKSAPRAWTDTCSSVKYSARLLLAVRGFGSYSSGSSRKTRRL